MKKNTLNINAFHFIVQYLKLFLCSIIFLITYINSGSAQVTKVKSKATAVPVINLTVKQIAADIQAPTAMVFPSKNEIWITEQSGKIRVVKDGKLISDAAIDISAKLVKMHEGYEERGLLGIALHPQFSENKKLYLYYSRPSKEKSNHTGVLAEYKQSPSGLINPDSERIILTIEEPDGNHNGGCIQFGPDKYLYLSLGDGGGQRDEHGKIGNGQDLTTLHGKILRLDINADSGYLVPKDNPFVSNQGARPEIWAYGFRNPWRFSFDTVSGKLFAGDVGQSAWEEIDIVTKGGNYGWRLKEGNHCHNPESGCDIPKSIAPIADYPHREGVSVTGGYVYNGESIPQIKGKYVFADWTGPIYYLQKSGTSWKRGKILLSNLAQNSKITAFGEDSYGELYVLTNPETGPENTKGIVYKIVKN